MKFGHQFLCSAVPEWIPFYLDYKLLKNLIYCDSNNVADLGITDEVKSLADGLIGKLDVNPTFITCLIFYLHRATCFYLRQLVEISEAIDKLESLLCHREVVPSEVFDEKAFLRIVLQTCADKTRVIDLLASFGAAHRVACYKLTKKHDKVKTGSAVSQFTDPLLASDAPMLGRSHAHQLTKLKHRLEDLAIRANGGERKQTAALLRRHQLPYTPRHDVLAGFLSGITAALFAVTIWLFGTFMNADLSSFFQRDLANMQQRATLEATPIIGNLTMIVPDWAQWPFGVVELRATLAFSVLVLYLWGLVLTIYGWSWARINHIFIFRLHLATSSLLPYIVFAVALLSWPVLLSASTLFFYGWSGRLPISHPEFTPEPLNAMTVHDLADVAEPFPIHALVAGAFFLVYFAPIPFGIVATRQWVASHLARYFSFSFTPLLASSAFPKVQFADFWLADQITSLSYAAVGITMLIPAIFGSSSTRVEIGAAMAMPSKAPLWFLCLSTAVVCFPMWVRMTQCISRYLREQIIHPHLTNAGKYIVQLLNASLGGLGGHFGVPISVRIAAAVAMYIYSVSWDSLVDFALLVPVARAEQHRRKFSVGMTVHFDTSIWLHEGKVRKVVTANASAMRSSSRRSASASSYRSFPQSGDTAPSPEFMPIGCATRQSIGKDASFIDAVHRNARLSCLDDDVSQALERNINSPAVAGPSSRTTPILGIERVTSFELEDVEKAEAADIAAEQVQPVVHSHSGESVGTHECQAATPPNIECVKVIYRRLPPCLRLVPRPHRVFKSSWPYVAIFLANAILRLVWVGRLYVGPITNLFFFELAAGVLEVIRRHLWNMFRLENEQVNNIENYRSTDDVPPLMHAPRHGGAISDELAADKL